MKCSNCGAEAEGNFCSSCGAPLKGRACPECGATVAPGDRFCTRCGTAVAPGAAVEAAPGDDEEELATAGGSNLGWWVAGVILVVAAVALGYPALTRNTSSAPAGAGAGPMGEAVDLSSMSLEEQATRLFNRVMTSASAGDTADVAFFLPKAIVIYEQLEGLDADGLFHFTLLYLTGGQYDSALAKAREGLEANPDHILLLDAAAEAALGTGDTATAREYFSRLLEVYDTEMTRTRPGYVDHQRLFPEYRSRAEAYLQGG